MTEPESLDFYMRACRAEIFSPALRTLYAIGAYKRLLDRGRIEEAQALRLEFTILFYPGPWSQHGWDYVGDIMLNEQDTEADKKRLERATET